MKGYIQNMEAWLHQSAETLYRLGLIPRPQGNKRRKPYAYVLLVMDEDGKAVDFRIVRTPKELSGTLSSASLLGRDILLHPNPVRLTKKFRQRYRKARSSKIRLKLAKELKLLTDENMLALQNLVLDIDSPFEKSYPVWLNIVRRLSFSGWKAFRTRSGNLRIWIPLAPGRNSLYLTPTAKGRNGRTHLEVARETVDILCAAFRKMGMDADTSFVDRINHPVWMETFRGPGDTASELVEDTQGSISLYALYNRVKSLQREWGLWDLTRVYWPEKFKPREKPKTKGSLPDPVAPKTAAFEQWEKAVTTLVQKHGHRRFIHILFPAVGWAKYLNLPEEKVLKVLRRLLPDKRDLDRDLQTAYRYANVLEFKPRRKTKTEVTNELMEKAITLIKEAKEAGVPRQVLLWEVAKGNSRLWQTVEKKLLEIREITRARVKVTPGKGRRAWVYYYQPYQQPNRKEEEPMKERGKPRGAILGGFAQKLEEKPSKPKEKTPPPKKAHGTKKSLLITSFGKRAAAPTTPSPESSVNPSAVVSCSSSCGSSGLVLGHYPLPPFFPESPRFCVGSLCGFWLPRGSPRSGLCTKGSTATVWVGWFCRYAKNGLGSEEPPELPRACENCAFFLEGNSECLAGHSQTGVCGEYLSACQVYWELGKNPPVKFLLVDRSESDSERGSEKEESVMEDGVLPFA